MAETKVLKRDDKIVEDVVLHGDLAELSPQDRVAYYARVCDSLGLNPFTRPFEFIRLNSKLTLYARRDATDQLRSLKGVGIEITNRELVDGVYVVTAKATMGERTDESIGAVDISKLQGDFRANAMMKAETKAKRRVTLSIVGLGWLDESEVGDISPSDGQTVAVNLDTGEIQNDGDEPEPLFDDMEVETPINWDWLRSSLSEVKWGWRDVSNWCFDHFTEAQGTTPRAVVDSLTAEHQEELRKEVQKRLDEKLL